MMAKLKCRKVIILKRYFNQRIRGRDHPSNSKETLTKDIWKILFRMLVSALRKKRKNAYMFFNIGLSHRRKVRVR